MKIKSMAVGSYRANCYIVYDEATKEAVVIDPGSEGNKIYDFIKGEGLCVKYIILTHCHFDHINAVPFLLKNTQARLAIGKNESLFLIHPEYMLSAESGLLFENVKSDIMLTQGDEIKINNLTFKVIETPGHTVGSVCLLCENSLFSGDTLFCESIGRSDLPTGGYDALINSVAEKLFLLADDITVYPGHGEATTIAHEKKYNPFV